MKNTSSIAKSAIAQNVDWKQAVEEVLAQTQGPPVDLALLFANGIYEEHFSDIVQQVRRETGARVLIGSSGRGIIGTKQELEEKPAVSLLTLTLPEAILNPVRFPQHLGDTDVSLKEWRDTLTMPPENIRAWLVLADPFSMNCQNLMERLTQTYKDIPLFGCLTSNNIPKRYSYVFLNDKVFDNGGVGLAIDGPYTLLPMISQGCKPLGRPWTITKIKENGFVETLSDIPAYEALMQTFTSLPPDIQQVAMRNMIVGLAPDEQEDALSRKEVLIRGILSADSQQGWLAFGGDTWVGQRIQFQIRDADAADIAFKESLNQLHSQVENTHPVAGILCSCHSRGEMLFKRSNHDAEMIAEHFGPLALTGLFGNGGMSSMETRPVCRAFAASFALLVEMR